MGEEIIEYGWVLLDLVPLDPEDDTDTDDDTDDDGKPAPDYALRVIGFTADESEACGAALAVRCAGIGEAAAFLLVGDSIIHGYATDWRLIWSALIPMADPESTSRILQSVTIVGIAEVPDWLGEAVVRFVEVVDRTATQPEENEA